jgi:excinuclease UvrABC nuclease subunit
MAEMAKTFDKKFGPEFIEQIPRDPGIYLVYNKENELIYVGKAKNLRRRLSQYRNAKRRKKHHKMLKIVVDADRIETQVHPSELEACLAEARLIQEMRPKWNVAGAFYFLYPMIGVRSQSDVVSFLYTTEPDELDAELKASFSMHGAFRSRFLCGEAFFSLIKLLEMVGHRNRSKGTWKAGTRKGPKISKHSYLYEFRQLPAEIASEFDLFFKGESIGALENLVLALLENAAARRSPKDIQKHLNGLRRFWRHEAQLLHRVRKKLSVTHYPIAQRERDFLFVKHRYGTAPTSAPVREPVREKAQEL